MMTEFLFFSLFYEAKSSSVDAVQDADLLSLYGKSGSSSMQTSLLDHLSPCQQQAKVKPQPGSLRNMFSISSSARVKSRWVNSQIFVCIYLINGFSPCFVLWIPFRFFAKESMSAPPATRTADKSGLAVLDEFDKEGMTPGSLDSGLGESIAGSQLDTEDQEVLCGRAESLDPENCSSVIVESHSVKKRLVFDGSTEPSSSKRLKVDNDSTEKFEATDDNITVLYCTLKDMQVVACHLMNLRRRLLLIKGYLLFIGKQLFRGSLYVTLGW